MTFRKLLAQTGVVFYVSSMIVQLFPATGVTVGFILVIISVEVLGLILLLIAGVLPQSETEDFGSMWPLVGYDNAIDAIYVRGAWLIRMREMDEQDLVNKITTGMNSLFSS